MAKLNPVEANMAGVARTFQNIRLFMNMSVLDNVKTGMGNSTKYGFMDAMLRTPKFRSEEKRTTDEAMDLLKLFELDQEAAGKKSLLSGDRKEIRGSGRKDQSRNINVFNI